MNTKRIAVALEGGLVSAVVSDDPSLIGIIVWVINYDTEGADENEIIQVKQHDGSWVEAVVHGDVIEQATVDLNSIEDAE